jgi:hypothetical protein
MSVEPPLMRDVLNGVLNSRIDASGFFSSFPFFQLTPAELAILIATGANPVVTYAWPPGYVDRYGSNAIPGTTPMAAAFSAAFAVASRTGSSVRWGATAPYLLEAPVNCTQMRGVVSWDESSKNLSAGAPSVIIGHDGQTYSHAFDLAASTEMTFNNLVAANLAGKVPNSLFFMARNAAGSGAGMHRFNNCRTDANARFAHVIYNYASEETNVNDCVFYQNHPGSTILNHNGTNPSGYTSNFVTIATGSQSNVTHRYRGCSLFQLGNSGSVNEVCIQIERTGNISFEEGSFYNPFGLCYVNMVGTAACSDFALTNNRGEQDGVHTCSYGVFVQTTGTTGVSSHVNWTLRGNSAVSSGEFLRLADTAEIVNLDMSVCTATSGLLLSAYNMSYSRVMHGTSVVTGRAGGTVSSVKFIGLKANVTLSGAVSPNVFDDVGLGQVAVDGVKFPATQVSSSNANTLDDYEEASFTPTITLGSGSVTAYTTQTGSYTKVGRLVTVQIFLQVSTVSAPAGSLKISNLPFASSSGLKGAVNVYANSIAAVATPIMGLVDSAATTVSLFKLVAGSLANMGGDVGAGTQLAVTASYET